MFKTNCFLFKGPGTAFHQNWNLDSESIYPVSNYHLASILVGRKSDFCLTDFTMARIASFLIAVASCHAYSFNRWSPPGPDDRMLCQAVFLEPNY